ncbi:hypothetical protein [Salinibaculum salinum]|uniref:hypothetical protein n=1 Tax=Salinibaculum salinum TaxID=3131996 RepID=UPI0030ED85C4
MEVTVTEEMMDNRKAVRIRIEEVANLSFDLSESSEYVNVGEISGRLLVEYEVNHGQVREEIERARNPTTKDKANAFFEDWSLAAVDPGTLEINYGSVLFRGTEPIDAVPEQFTLTATLDTDEFQRTAPEDLKRKLRQEKEYTVAYDDLESDIKAYLEREGINTDQVSLGSPIHIQARAEPIAEEDVFGTEFRLTVENQVIRELEPSTLRVSMPPQIGREILLDDQTTGSYDPAEEEFVFDIPRIPPAEGQPKVHEISFLVPQEAGQDLEQIEGSATLNTSQPFTNYLPEAVFDAGGNKIYDDQVPAESNYASVDPTCSIEADFSTPTSEILVGDVANVTKKIRVDGVTPPQAYTEIESVLNQRGIDAAGTGMSQSEEIREGANVTEFNGRFEDGSIVVGDTRIAVNISVNGERRTGETGTERASGEELPAKQRNVTMDYGHTGIQVIAKGADPQKVDSFASDLRDEIKLSLQSIAEEV